MSIDKDECVEWWRIPVYVIKEKIAEGLWSRDMCGGYKQLSQFYLFKKEVFAPWRGV
jgi:hypothetical protein